MVNSTARGSVLIASVITLLALVDGILHFSLDFILFRGNIFGRLGPPPGAPPPGGPGGGGPPPPWPLPFALNQLFALNLVGYVVLVLLLWFVAPRLGNLRWIVDVLFILYIAVVIAGWLRIGAPNPMGLGYLSKALEVILIVLVLVHMWPPLATRSTSVAEPL